MAETFTDRVTLDARPDRIDFRDREYRPPLVSLPETFPSQLEITTFLPLYKRMRRVLDQGREGACTGFGLAAVINYIIWDRWVRENWQNMQNEGEDFDFSSAPRLVSPWMLYDNARMYDEWEGEDYSGSSCRGAMKGWHKHGVCDDLKWFREMPASGGTPRYRRPEGGWQEDAAARPLGAYFRVDVRSIADMQAAIREVRAVFCSGRVHDGWNVSADDPGIDVAGLNLPRISQTSDISGGHAFALVGYTPDGFIVQNSWGGAWGQMGFGLLPYEDWAENAHDAWVAAMAAPMRVAGKVAAPIARAETPLHFNASVAAQAGRAAAGTIQPWSRDEAYHHGVVMGNDGKLIRRLTDTRDAADSLQKVAFDLPQEAIDAGTKHVLLYAHGGLNAEKAAMERAMRMGPWLKANGIYPIFLIWRTSLQDSLMGIGADFVGQFMSERDELRAKGIGDIFDRAVDRLQKKFDSAFEAAAEKVIGKAVWSQMKQNAGAASVGSGGARRLSKTLGKLLEQNPDTRLHLAGHSAGSLLLGHMLGDLPGDGRLDSVHLYAPACTTDFAVRNYGRALKKGVIPKGRLFIDLLSVEQEVADSVGPYGKSLLWLVSRAFEDPRKMPLLGLARAWPSLVDARKPENALDLYFQASRHSDIDKWSAIAKEHKVRVDILGEEEVTTKMDPGGTPLAKIAANHGSFDNALSIVNRSVRRSLRLPASKDLPREILDLTAF